MMTDANAHVHSEEDTDVEHAQHFVKAVDDIGLCSNVDSIPLNTFQPSHGTWVQNNYIATSPGIHAVEGSQVANVMAHSALAG